MFRIIRFLLVLFLPLAGCYSQAKEDPFTWDFGKVKEGDVLRHKFRLKNETAKILNIKDVSTSCGCTLSKVEKKTLLPGELTVIEVKMDTKGYSGLVQQFVYVNTDGSSKDRTIDNPIFRFIIKANVEKIRRLKGKRLTTFSR